VQNLLVTGDEHASVGLWTLDGIHIGNFGQVGRSVGPRLPRCAARPCPSVARIEVAATRVCRVSDHAETSCATCHIVCHVARCMSCAMWNVVRHMTRHYLQGGEISKWQLGRTSSYASIEPDLILDEATHLPLTAPLTVSTQ
jgi:hypothetical protein